MYAVIRAGGKQYRVQENDTINIEKIDGAPGDNITLGEVLAIGGGVTARVSARRSSRAPA
jgi:large subunit ribosomal protein L21